MKHTYVKCKSCDYRVENNSDPSFWINNPCEHCKNTRQVIDPKEILCNMCGECMCPLGTMNEQYPHGLHKAKVNGGFDSYHLFDMTSYIFSFCEKCLRTLFNQCKIKPNLHEGGPGDPLDYDILWEKDQEAYAYRVWRDDGGHHQAYLNRKCNEAKNCPNEALYTRLSDGEFTEDCCCEKHKEILSKYMVNIELTKFIPNVLKPFL